MSVKRALQLIASFALSVALMALLINIAKIDVGLTLRHLRAVRWIAFAKIVLLSCLFNLLSTEKWRSIDATLRRSTDSVPSRTASFALTSAGVALGIFLPVQFAVATTRTLGTYVHGGALRRGTAGTLYEQSFDVATACLLAVVSGLTWFYEGGGLMWTISAVIMLCLALLGVGPSVRLIRWLAAKCLGGTESPQGPIATILHSLSDFLHSDLLNTESGAPPARALGGPLCSDCLNVRADGGSDRCVHSYLEHGCNHSLCRAYVRRCLDARGNWHE